MQGIIATYKYLSIIARMLEFILKKCEVENHFPLKIFLTFTCSNLLVAALSNRLQTNGNGQDSGKPVELNLMSIYFSGAKANNLFSLCPRPPVSLSNIQWLIQAQPLAHHTILSSFYYIKYIYVTAKQINS